jgi:drug/metabolite transporter (DMT)-like permease
MSVPQAGNVSADISRNRMQRQIDVQIARTGERFSPVVEIALLGVLATLWGASYSFIKLAVATIPPVTLMAARTTIAGALLLIVMRWHGLSLPIDRATWLKFDCQALLNSAVPFTLIAWGEQTVDAALATTLNATSPVFAFLATYGITRHEPATLRMALGVASGILGIGLIVGAQAFHRLGRDLTSQLAIVAATLCYAGAAIAGRTFAGHNPLLPATGTLICSACMLTPASLIIDRPWALVPSGASVVALLALSVFSTALAFVIYFRVLETLGSVGTTAQAYLRVPIGVFIGVLFLGERLAPSAWIGLACVAAGVAAMTIPREQRR